MLPRHPIDPRWCGRPPGRPRATDHSSVVQSWEGTREHFGILSELSPLERTCHTPEGHTGHTCGSRQGKNVGDIGGPFRATFYRRGRRKRDEKTLQFGFVNDSRLERKLTELHLKIISFFEPP